ncbi:MAG: DUF2254 domain-containing protein [Roseobacter sp.]
MTTKFTWLILEQRKKVWVRVVAFACLAAASVVFARLASTYVPQSWTGLVSVEAVDQLLEIMASSMLAVTTFSLSVAVSAFTAAAQSATPRATTLLQEDPTTQNVLSTFLGAFIFSLVALLALKGGFYSDVGVVVLFAATAFVVLLVILAFLRWISHLMTFGRIGDTLDRVEAAAAHAFALRQANPCLGAQICKGERPEDAEPIYATSIGYVQHIDVQSLSDCADKVQTRLWVQAVTGDYVHERTVLAYCEAALDDTVQGKIRAAFTCDRARNFDQDPRFGLTVLSEIASRALSPAVNDPGTAIDVIGRLLRVLSAWRAEHVDTPRFERVFVPPIRAEQLLNDAFNAIGRDAAQVREVHLCLYDALQALTKISPETFKGPAAEVARRAVLHAQKSDMIADEQGEVLAAAKVIADRAD